jgi:two-component system response regulator CpxR
MERILLVDDDVELCEILSEFFAAEGFQIETVNDGIRGLERARSGEHALVILDLLLPGLRGLEVLRKLRADSHIPVLILTARGQDVDRILGLEIGADDYLPKPFNSRELLARVRAILRRARPVADSKRIAVGDVALDPAARRAWSAGKRIDLTTAEFTLLESLLREAGHVLSRDHLAETVLGRKLAPFDRSIDVHVSNLRKKLGSLPGGEERIKAVRGTGYVFVRFSEEGE